MKLGSNIDYHGSRNYGADLPNLPWSKLLLDWLVSIARRPKPAPPRHPKEATFTMLGVSSRVSRRMRADPFPLAPGKNDNSRNMPSCLRNED
jgi:hypothetical protein